MVNVICFDTTASNTGRKNGACPLIEQDLGKQLLYFACRHHIFELVSEAVFSVQIKTSCSPDVLLFKRFKSKWSCIDNSDYRTALDDEYAANAITDIKDDIVAFAEDQLSTRQPQDDYRELLEITILFLGSRPHRGVHIMAPGAMHKARWMAKAIYAIKIWMFAKQFKLTKTEDSGLRDVAIFVSSLYVKAWFQAPLSTSAPAADLQLLKDLKKYETVNKKVSQAAFKKLSGHLWYIGEELVALAFFDRNVSCDEKRLMVQALQSEGNQEIQRRVDTDSIDETTIDTRNLHDFVTANTRRFFEILGLDSHFLDADPESWAQDDRYIAGETTSKSLTVINDTAERGVALCEQYNDLHTCDEEQKQYLLLAVSEHRKRYPDFKKSTLTAPKWPSL